MTPDEINWAKEVVEIIKTLPRVEGKVDKLAEKIDGRPCMDHENRLREVERRPQAKRPWVKIGSFTGAASIISAILGWLATKA